MNKPSRTGLTLVELLMVLLILAILTTLAVQATGNLVDQARYEGTQRLLTDLQDATLGRPGQRQNDGSLIISGFVADMGRPPQMVGSDPLKQLQELWLPTGEAFGLKAAPGDADVLVPCGWRGPYVRLPLGTSELRDGWGNALSLTFNSTTQWLESASSLGADNLSGGSDYNTDLTVGVAGQYGAVVSGQVRLVNALGQPRDAEGAITVTLFGPNPATGGALATPATVNATPISQGVYTYTVSTTIGPRVVRAYEASAPARNSRVLYLTVPLGGLLQELQIVKP